MICPDCKEDTVIKVGMADGLPVFSCHNEDCENYAHILVMTADFGFMRHDKLLNELINVIETYEQDNTGESES